jgi:hypothetical protein
MPLDQSLPPSRLSADPSAEETVRQFSSVLGVRVDLEGLNTLPAQERLSLAGARLPEPPEAVLLDRVLQLVPPVLLRPVERIVIVQSRGTARFGGSRGRIVRLSAQEARVGEADPRYGGGFSLFTTTVLHEVGHVVFEACLTAEQRDQLSDEYIEELDARPSIPPGAPTQLGLEHYFIRFFVAALPGRGESPLSGSAARRRLAELGVELRRQ